MRKSRLGPVCHEVNLKDSLPMSLVAADVRRLILSDPGVVTPVGVIESVFRWDQATLTWLPVGEGESLFAGTVLWLHASTSATTSIVGKYIPPLNSSVPIGPSFQPGAGLEIWNLQSATSDLPYASLWKFDGPSQTWLAQYGTNLMSQSGLPTKLAVGEGFMARVDTAMTIEVPESTLRIRYYHQDHLGSSSVVSDDNGKVVEQISHYAFGHTHNQYGSSGFDESYLYSQKERDEESGLYYFEARYFFTNGARFCKPDPRPFLLNKDLAIPQMLNSYAYCANRPIVQIDPTGCVQEESQSIEQADPPIRDDARSMTDKIERMGNGLEQFAEYQQSQESFDYNNRDPLSPRDRAERTSQKFNQNIVAPGFDAYKGVMKEAWKLPSKAGKEMAKDVTPTEYIEGKAKEVMKELFPMMMKETQKQMENQRVEKNYNLNGTQVMIRKDGTITITDSKTTKDYHWAQPVSPQ